MTLDISSVVTAIDAAVEEPRCRHCDRSLGDSPSADFCSENCQHSWHTAQAEPAPESGWLGPPPPGIIARPGHDVLDAVAAFVARFSVFPSEHCVPTLALWYAHTHATEQFYVTPRLVLDSAEPGSGKTRVLEVAQYLVRAPEMTISATPPRCFALWRSGPSPSSLMKSTPSSYPKTEEISRTFADYSTPDTNARPRSPAASVTPKT